MRDISMERVAFRHRLKHAALPWKCYVTRFRAAGNGPSACVDVLVSLRFRIVSSIKRAATEYSESSDKNTERMKKRKVQQAPSPNDYVIIPELSRMMSTSSPTDSFILDFGSVNETSNADITLLDVYSLEIVNFIIDRVRAEYGAALHFGFNEQNLQSIFDISLYINSFLINIAGNLAYVNTDGKIHSRQKQRRHARSRLREATRRRGGQIYNSIDKRDLDRILTRKKLALFAHDLHAVLDLTSRTARAAYPDAYRSQGAFLHVLIEIQAGVRLPFLKAPDYLDSAYDNLGLLLNAATLPDGSITKNTNSAAFSKYVSRISHALRRMAEARIEAARDCKELVSYFDAVSFQDTSRACLSCAMGLMSHQLTVRNQGARHTSFYNGIFAQRKAYQRRMCAYFVPHRSLSINVSSFVKSTQTSLDSIARRYAI